MSAGTEINMSIQGFVRKPREGATKSGTPLFSFMIARDRKSRGQDVTDFYNITAYDKIAESLIELNKKENRDGTKGLAGRYMKFSVDPRTERYLDKETGKETSVVNYVVNPPRAYSFMLQPSRPNPTNPPPEDQVAEVLEQAEVAEPLEEAA